MFPAIYAWGQYEDFKTQLRHKWKQQVLSAEELELARITADSTFKPKPLVHKSLNQSLAIELV